MISQRDAQYDLFISYAEDDRAWVNGYLLDALAQAGLRCLTESAFALGSPKILEFERAVQQSKRVLLVLSPAYLTDQALAFIDVLAQGFGLETSTWPVIPLILHEVKLPIRLSTLTSLDMTDLTQQQVSLSRLLSDLQRSQIPEVGELATCPYPGMEPFNEANSARFFGRDQEIQESLNNLRLHPFLTFIGPSGSGKSSMVMAGLVPALHKSGLFGDGKWLVRYLRPGDTPLKVLADQLGGDVSDSVQAVTGTLAKEQATRLLLIVDQFEEVFTLAPSSILPFQEALLKLSGMPNCYVIVTVRADFYPALMAVALLWREVQAHRLEVLPLDDDGLRQAIIRPAETVEVYVEAALVERLIADTAGEPGTLPLLQETLRLLWERLERRYLPLRAYESLVMTRRAYGATGTDRLTGLQVAIVSRANNALAGLNAEQQALARRIFLQLIQFGEGREDTRRQQSVETLQVGSDPTIFASTLEHLVANRLLIVSGAETGGSRKVDIAHEALIKSWPTLQEWLRQNREAEQTHRRLESKTLEWVQMGRGAGGLLDEIELGEADRWLASPDATTVGYSRDLKELVETSRSALHKAREEKERAREYRSMLERRAKNRARFIAGSLAVFSIILLILGAYAYNQRNEAISNAQIAQTNAAIANDNAREALSRQLAAQSLLNLKSQPDLAALLSLYAGTSKDTFEARSSMLNVLQLNGHFVAALEDNPSAIYSLAYNPRTDQVALGGDGIIVFWDVQKRQVIGSPLRDEKQPMRIVRSIAFSSDGMLVSGSDDGAIRVWDLGNRTATALVPQDNTKMGTVYSITFGCDGAFLASGTDDGFIRLWNANTHEAIDPPLNAEKVGSIRSLVFSHKGCVLASGDTNGDVKLWDVNTRQPIEINARRKHSNWVLSLAFSSDDKTLASGGADRQILLWDTEKHESVGVPLDGSNWVRSLAFASNEATSSLLASGGDDGTILLWDWQAVRRGQTIRPMTFPLTGHSGGIYGLAFARDDQLLISGAADHKAILWRIDSRIHTFGQALSDISKVQAICSTGQTIAIGQADGAIVLWDVANQRQHFLNSSRSRPVLSLACSPDGKTLISGDVDGNMMLWDIATGQSTPFRTQHSGAVQALIFSKDGGQLASAGEDGKVLLWDPSDRQLTPVSLTGSQDIASINSLAFSPDAATLASGDDKGNVLLWAIKSRTAQQIQKISSGNATSVAFSPNGNILAYGGNDGLIRLWDVKGQSPIGVPLQGHDSRYPVYSLAFSPDGQILASGGGDNNVILWDLKTHLPLGIPLIGYTGPIRSLAFNTGAGLMLASGSSSTPGVILWDLASDHWKKYACAIANRPLIPDEKSRFLGQMDLELAPCQ
jgi:WD40 repeat protein